MYLSRNSHTLEKVFICSLFQRICSILAHIGQQAPTKRSEVMDYFKSSPGCSCRTQQSCYNLFSKCDFCRALTWWSDRLAARSGQRRAGNPAASRVRGHVRHCSHSVAGALIIHSHAVGEGVTHRVVGLAVVAANLLRLLTGILRVIHKVVLVKRSTQV